MALQPGGTVFAGETAETRPLADGVAAGDAVALANGEAVAADSEANDLGGVAGQSDRAVLGGGVVAAVADGVTEGSRLNSGNTTGGTTGQLIADSDGPAVALSDEGGTWHGLSEKTYDVPDGYAVVYL